MPPNNYKMTNGSLKNHFIPKIQSIHFFFCQGQMRTFTIPIHHRESLLLYTSATKVRSANEQFTGTKEDEILDQKIR